MKKTNKTARVNFVTDDYGEYYNIELWDNESGYWCLCSSFRFVKCAEHPEWESSDFLHFDIVNKLLELMQLGYTIIDNR